MPSESQKPRQPVCTRVSLGSTAVLVRHPLIIGRIELKGLQGRQIALEVAPKQKTVDIGSANTPSFTVFVQ